MIISGSSIIFSGLIPPNSSVPLSTIIRPAPTNTNPSSPCPFTTDGWRWCSSSSKKVREPRLVVASAAAWVPLPLPPGSGSLEEEDDEFGGVSFSEIGESCVVRMAAENGSVARVMLPSGLITSYKPLMWHGGTMELLHTNVSQGKNGGEALIHGGVSLDFKCHVDGALWSPNSSWILREVKGGSPHEFIQVVLIAQNAGANVQVQHVITLKEDVLRSEVVVSNSSHSSCHFTAAIRSHLTLSTPEATYALGLEGSDFVCGPPVCSDFSLIHPSFGKTAGSTKQQGFFELLSRPGHKKYEERGHRITQQISEGQEDDDYKNLQEEMSRIYTNAPRTITILDRVNIHSVFSNFCESSILLLVHQGRRNSVHIGREGFKELYLFSPGSSFEWYGKYAYVCIGQAALLQPVTLGSQCQWRGKQHLCNPNL